MEFVFIARIEIVNCRMAMNCLGAHNKTRRSHDNKKAKMKSCRKREGGKQRKTRSVRARGLSLFSVTTRPRSGEYLKKFV